MNPYRSHSESPLGPSTRQRLDAARGRFEDAWRDGPRPRIEDYLSGLAEDEQIVLFRDLLRREFALRRHAGEDVHVQDYLDRFPDRAALIPSFFSQEETDLSN